MIARLALVGLLTYWLPLALLTIGGGTIGDRIVLGLVWTITYELMVALVFIVAIRLSEARRPRR